MDKFHELVKGGLQLLKSARNDFGKVIKAAEKQLYLERFFDSLVKTLRKLEAPKTIIGMVESQKSKVVKKAMTMIIDQGNLPFIPIIGLHCLGYYGLMSLVRRGDKLGYCDPDIILSHIRCDKVAISPDNIEFLFNVDERIGRGYQQDVNETFDHDKRPRFNAIEIINLAIYIMPLTLAQVIWSTSYYNNNPKQKMGIFLVEGRPKFGVVKIEGTDPDKGHWLMPSCNHKK